MRDDKQGFYHLRWSLAAAPHVPSSLVVAGIKILQIFLKDEREAKIAAAMVLFEEVGLIPREGFFASLGLTGK